MPSKIIMSAWRDNYAHLSKKMSIKPHKSHPNQATDRMILRFGSKTDTFMLYISKYYKQGINQSPYRPYSASPRLDLNQGLVPTTPLVPRYESGLILILLKINLLTYAFEIRLKDLIT